MLEDECDLKELYFTNRSMHDPWYFVYFTIYMILPIVSVVANVMLLIAHHRFIKNRIRQQNKDRNLLIRPLKPGEIIRDRLIYHLAVLDILLSITMPLTALHILPKFWPLGKDTEVLCQLTKTSPTVIVYSSSMLIILIAANCYRQIVIPHKKQLLPNDLKYIITGIVFLSIVVSIPQFVYTRLFQLFENDTELPANYGIETTERPMSAGTRIATFSSNSSLAVKSEEEKVGKRHMDVCKQYDRNGWSHVVFCIEQWPFENEHLDPKSRLNYSIFVFVTQLVIPLIIISCCYHSVYRRLQSHHQMRRVAFNFQKEERLQKQNRRSNRQNKHIAMRSLIYLILWLPLGIMNLLLDSNPYILGKNTSHVVIVVATCHLIAMCSTIANPIIYGYTNKHIRKGIFHLIYLPYFCVYKIK